MNSVHNQLTSLGSRAFIDVVPWGVKPMDPAYGCSWMLSIGFSPRCAAPHGVPHCSSLPVCPAPDGTGKSTELNRCHKNSSLATVDGQHQPIGTPLSTWQLKLGLMLLGSCLPSSFPASSIKAFVIASSTSRVETFMYKIH